MPNKNGQARYRLDFSKIPVSFEKVPTIMLLAFSRSW